MATALTSNCRHVFTSVSVCRMQSWRVALGSSWPIVNGYTLLFWMPPSPTSSLPFQYTATTICLSIHDLLFAPGASRRGNHHVPDGPPSPKSQCLYAPILPNVSATASRCQGLALNRCSPSLAEQPFRKSSKHLLNSSGGRRHTTLSSSDCHCSSPFTCLPELM